MEKTKISMDDYSDILEKAFAGASGAKVFIDGWAASINGTLQSYKDDVRIVF